MTDLAYIDDYFTITLPPDEKQRFEQRVANDETFAETVAFYLAAKQLAAEAANNTRKQQFKALHENKKQETIVKKIPVMRYWYGIAAAGIAIVVITGLLWLKPASPQQMANTYAEQSFGQLGITMSATHDSLQAALTLYNAAQYGRALQQFEQILQRDNGNFDAIKYAGIVCLRQKDYNKAIKYFVQLQQMEGRYANPGKFYQAVALLQRNKNDDKTNAKALLEQVVQQDLEGRQTAEVWLKKW